MILGIGFGSRYAFRYALIGMVLALCLSVFSWGACAEYTFDCGYAAYCGCGQGWGSQETCDGTPELRGCQVFNNPNCPNASPQGCGNWYGTACKMTVTVTNNTYVVTKIACDTQEEADSVYCAVSPTAENCQDDLVPENCQEDYRECVSMGGVWKEVGSTSEGCQSECDLCGTKGKTRVMNAIANVCCKQGLAPPDSVVQCFMPASTGPGMTSSVMNDKNNTYQCGQLTTSDGGAITENQELYKRFCIDEDMYEEQADTNDVSGGGESSSSSGTEETESSASGTSFATELDALDGIYGVLDTIRDTLVKRLTPATEEIRDCLYNFKLCTQLDSLYVDWSAMPKDSTWFYIDTGLVKYLRPFMNASVALDSNQLNAIRKLDTNALKQLHLDSALLKNDTSTRQAVNSGFEGVLKNDTVTRRAVNRLDTTVVGLDSSLRKGIREGTDNLIDSMDRYLGRVDSSIGAVGSNGTALGDSLGSIHGAIDGVVNSLDSSIRSGYGSADTGSGNFPWISQGESQRDSIFGGGPGGTGFGGLDFGGDSAWMDSMENIGYVCDGDSCCIGDKCEYFESDSMIVDSLQRHAQRLGDSVRALNEAFYRDSVDNIFEEVKDSLKAFNPLHIFDSTLLSKLGASIPNSNTCPEHCSTFQVDIPFFFGTQHVVIDWGLCMGRTAFANGNVLSFLRFIIRIIVAVTCITAVMWNATRIRR